MAVSLYATFIINNSNNGGSCSSPSLESFAEMQTTFLNIFLGESSHTRFSLLQIDSMKAEGLSLVSFSGQMSILNVRNIQGKTLMFLWWMHFKIVYVLHYIVWPINICLSMDQSHCLMSLRHTYWAKTHPTEAVTTVNGHSQN